MALREPLEEHLKWFELDGVIVIRDNLAGHIGDGLFLVAHAVAYSTCWKISSAADRLNSTKNNVQRNPIRGTVLVATLEGYSHYAAVCGKLGLRLDEAKDKGAFAFINAKPELPDTSACRLRIEEVLESLYSAADDEGEGDDAAEGAGEDEGQVEGSRKEEGEGQDPDETQKNKQDTLTPTFVTLVVKEQTGENVQEEEEEKGHEEAEHQQLHSLDEGAKPKSLKKVYDAIEAAVMAQRKAGFDSTIVIEDVTALAWLYGLREALRLWRMCRLLTMTSMNVAMMEQEEQQEEALHHESAVHQQQVSPSSKQSASTLEQGEHILPSPPEQIPPRVVSLVGRHQHLNSSLDHSMGNGSIGEGGGEGRRRGMYDDAEDDEDDVILENLLCSQADTLVDLQPLDTGYAKEVHGKIVIRTARRFGTVAGVAELSLSAQSGKLGWRNVSYNYKVGETGVRCQQCTVDRGGPSSRSSCRGGRGGARTGGGGGNRSGRNDMATSYYDSNMRW